MSGSIKLNRRDRSVAIGLFAGILLGSGANAPVWAAEPGRPQTAPLTLPSFEAPMRSPQLLPPIPPRRRSAFGGDTETSELAVTSWHFEGNTVFSDEELADVVKGWTGRAILPRELQAARDALTLHYVSRGYFTSGAQIPDQDVAEGRVRVQIYEGSLTEIRFTGQERLSRRYLRNQLGRVEQGPLFVPRLEEKIRLLQLDERIARVDAALRPADRLGAARLELAIEEADPIDGSLELSNFLADSLGDVRGRARFRHRNVSGLGDELTVLLGGYEAGPEVEARYRVPFGRFGTTFGIGARFSDSNLVDELGEELRVEGNFWNVELDLRQPLIRTPSLEIAAGGGAALRQSNTELLGEEINEVGSRTRVFVFRLYQELTWRAQSHVLAARSTVNIGSLGLGATRSSRNSIPDSQFASWLIQAQYLKRFDPWNLELLIRADLQLANDPLLSLEQISVGGHATVRGYRENQIVRDQGFSASAEVRFPLWTDPVDGRTIIQLAPFFDLGGGWQRNRPTNTPKRLASAGLAFRVAPWRFLRGELIWAERLRDVSRPSGLQGDGIHFRIVLDLDRGWLKLGGF